MDDAQVYQFIEDVRPAFMKYNKGKMDIISAHGIAEHHRSFTVYEDVPIEKLRNDFAHEVMNVHISEWTIPEFIDGIMNDANFVHNIGANHGSAEVKASARLLNEGASEIKDKFRILHNDYEKFFEKRDRERESAREVVRTDVAKLEQAIATYKQDRPGNSSEQSTEPVRQIGDIEKAIADIKEQLKANSVDISKLQEANGTLREAASSFVSGAAEETGSTVARELLPFLIAIVLPPLGELMNSLGHWIATLLS